jgi:hypothetical protein
MYVDPCRDADVRNNTFTLDKMCIQARTGDRTSVMDLKTNVPLAVSAWFKNDGAPAHFSPDVRKVLNNTCQDKGIRTTSQVARPPRSPALSRYDFYLWRNLKP